MTLLYYGIVEWNFVSFKHIVDVHSVSLTSFLIKHQDGKNTANNGDKSNYEILLRS